MNQMGQSNQKTGTTPDQNGDPGYELRFQENILANVSDAIVTLDLDFYITSWNNAAERIYGWTEQETLGKRYMEIIPIDFPPHSSQDEVREILLNTGEWEGETTQHSKRGNKLRIYSCVSNLKDAHGNQLGWVTVNRDITEKVRVEEELRKSEVKRHLILEHIPAFIVELDQEGTILTLNKVMDGFAVDDFLGKSIFEIDYPIHVEPLKSALREVIDSKEGFTFEGRNVDPQGKLTWFNVQQETTQLLETIFEHTHTCIAYLDTQFNFVQVNRAYAEGDYKDPSYFPGKNHFDLYPNQSNQRIFQNVVDTGEAYFSDPKNPELVDDPKRGSTYWDWSLVPIKEPDGSVTGLVLTLIDVTERMEARKELTVLVKELNCLYRISQMVEVEDLSKKDIAQRTLELIPLAWQFPDITCVRISLDGQSYTTYNFNETRWVQASAINMNGDTVGKVEVYYLEDKPESYEGPFLEEERFLLNEIAGRLGNLLERNQTKTAEEEQRVFAQALAESAANIRSTLDLNEVLDRILETIDSVVPYDWANIMLMNPDQKTATAVRITPDKDEYHHTLSAESHVPINEFHNLATMVETHQPYVVPNIRQDPHWIILEGGDWVHAYIGAPLVIENTVIGFIHLLSTTTDFYNPTHGDHLQAFADQASVAIQNAMLFEQVHELGVIEERHRLARDMHDVVSQTLFSASVMSETLQRLVVSDSNEVNLAIRDLHLLTRGALAEMRTLLLELRPEALIQSDLGELIKQLADGLTGRTKVEISCRVDGTQPLPPDVQTTFFRIAQEAMNNIVRHANANRVTIYLSNQPEQVYLQISDDGCGTDFENLPPDRLGIQFMQERAEKIGADLVMTSQPGQGTDINLTWSNPHEDER
jgi:PAS domain S-box-containing protein